MVWEANARTRRSRGLVSGDMLGPEKKHDSAFALAFQGVRNNAENFKVRVLQEHAGEFCSIGFVGRSPGESQDHFGPSPMLEPHVVLPSFDALLSHESNPILSKRVLGREDVDIAAMIKALGNSDWVRQGPGLLR